MIALVNGGYHFAKLLAEAVRLLLIVLILAMALEQLQVAPNIVVAAFSIIFGGQHCLDEQRRKLVKRNRFPALIPEFTHQYPILGVDAQGDFEMKIAKGLSGGELGLEMTIERQHNRNQNGHCSQHGSRQQAEKPDP